MASSEDHDEASRSNSPGSTGDPDNSTMEDIKSENAQNEAGEVKRKDPKDPSRPRRKKARRACHACQRAHLTCGDERPCQRCIKRGLADQCCDGVRKKAKYLHDTPNEAFLPGGMSRFGYMDSLRQGRPPPEMPFNLSPQAEVFPQMQGQPGFPIYRQNASPPQVRETVMGPQPYIPVTQTPASAFPSPTNPQPNMQSLLDAANRSMSMDQTTPVQEQPFGNTFFDPNDLSKYNFDPSTFNFGNHYGALEFGMLGHMATGAAETPPSDAATQLGQNYTSPATVGFADSPARDRSFSLGDQSLPNWQQQPALPPDIARMDHQNQYNMSQQQTPRQKPLPTAIPMNFSHTIDMSGRPTGTLTPPATDMMPQIAGTPGISVNNSSDMFPGDGTASTVLATAKLFAPQQPNRNTSSIYSSVQKEYSYVTSWHNLTAFMRKRFPTEKTLRIARAISAFRPSFIGATKSLSKDDLIFMEKCFQRTLCIYEDFLKINCTPTIVCRRTGEVCAVSDEFVQLTGWSRDILLGKEANFNSNTGKGTDMLSSGATTASTAQSGGRGGVNTPRAAEVPVETSRPQAVFHAELMDDDSVIEFYEDFARLAFGEPRGRVNTRMRLLRYRTKSDTTSNAEDIIDSECVWTIKRDVFDLPMMIVMNFLPVLD